VEHLEQKCLKKRVFDPEKVDITIEKPLKSAVFNIKTALFCLKDD